MSRFDRRSLSFARRLCVAIFMMIGMVAPRASAAETVKPADPKTPAVKPKPLTWYSAYLQACAEARKSDRLILAYFCSSDGDEWTTKLDKEVMGTEMFHDFAEKNLILLKLDFLKFKPNSMQKEQNDRLMRKYNVTKVPTLLFLDQDGLLIARCGYDTAALREEELKGQPIEWIKHCEDVIKNRPPAEPIIEQKTLEECLIYAKKHYLPMLLLITKGDVPMIAKTKAELLKNQPFVKFINQNYAFCQIQWPAESDTSPSAKAFREFVEANKIGPANMQLVVYDNFQPTTKVRARIYGITTQDIDPLIERLDREVPNPDYSGQWLDDWRQAKFISNRLRRPLFICFTSMDSSEYCQKFDQEIFKTDEFIKYAKKNIVLLRVDFPKDEKKLAAQSEALREQNKQLADQFAIRGYPTVVILNFMGQRIGDAKYMKGGPEFFLKQLDQVVRNDKFSRP